MFIRVSSCFGDGVSRDRQLTPDTTVRSLLQAEGVNVDSAAVAVNGVTLGKFELDRSLQDGDRVDIAPNKEDGGSQ